MYNSGTVDEWPHRPKMSDSGTIPDDHALYDLSARVGERLLARGERVATVESCTGGWIAKALTDVPGSSGWVEAALVTYGNEAKQRLAGVSVASLEAAGAVSEAVVREMAAGALDRTSADRSVAVSGVAGPAGGTPAKPIGTVWVAWARRVGPQPSVRTRLLHLAGDRETIRRLTVAAALEGLLDDD
jgi:nicotinamide-nucleotide amidase